MRSSVGFCGNLDLWITFHSKTGAAKARGNGKESSHKGWGPVRTKCSKISLLGVNFHNPYSSLKYNKKVRQPKLPHSKTQPRLSPNKLKWNKAITLSTNFPGFAFLANPGKLVAQIGIVPLWETTLAPLFNLFGIVMIPYLSLKFNRILENSTFSLSFWYVLLTENRKGWGVMEVRKKRKGRSQNQRLNWFVSQNSNINSLNFTPKTLLLIWVTFTQ